MYAQPFVSARSLICLALLLLGSAGSAHALTINVSLTGLPRGLDVKFELTGGYCTDIEGEDFPTIELTEEPIPGPSLVIPLSVYKGQLRVLTRRSSGCRPGDSGALFYMYTVAGVDEQGNVAERQVISSLFYTGNSEINLKDDASASTKSIRARGITPTSLPAGGSTTLLVNYSDSAGEAWIANPSLSISRPTILNGLRINVTVARAFISTDQQVCLTSVNTTQCRPLYRNGTVAAGGVSINVSQVQISSSGNGFTIFWPIKLDAAFQAGSCFLSASANDVDSFSYFVHGIATPLDLLPWKALSIPVEITN